MILHPVKWFVKGFVETLKTRKSGKAVMSRLSWEPVFTDQEHEFHPELDEPTRKAAALAAAYSGWGCCCIEGPPENFGWGMLKLKDILGFMPTIENLDANRERVMEEYHATRA